MAEAAARPAMSEGETGAQGGALARLRALLPTLQPSDERVARSILEAPEATVHRSVSEAAEVAGVDGDGRTVCTTSRPGDPSSA